LEQIKEKTSLSTEKKIELSYTHLPPQRLESSNKDQANHIKFHRTMKTDLSHCINEEGTKPA